MSETFHTRTKACISLRTTRTPRLKTYLKKIQFAVCFFLYFVMKTDSVTLKGLIMHMCPFLCKREKVRRLAKRWTHRWCCNASQAHSTWYFSTFLPHQNLSHTHANSLTHTHILSCSPTHNPPSQNVYFSWEQYNQLNTESLQAPEQMTLILLILT